MAKIYYDKDADLALLKGKTIAIIGYGSQGHAHALNLRDSGCEVHRRPSCRAAEIVEAGQEAGLHGPVGGRGRGRADIIMMLVPDEVQAQVYREDIAPNLKAGKTLMFAHGFNIHFGQIVPPADVDVSMVAPKGPGHLVRARSTPRAAACRP